MTLTAILDWHLERYPLLVAADVYKLIHQGVYGPGHIITDPTSAREHLLREHSALSVIRHSSFVIRHFCEPLSPDSRFIRVNLHGLDRAAVERLLAALLESAREVPTEHATMRARLEAAVQWAQAKLPGADRELHRLSVESEPLNFPARHHSAAYRDAYRPAYRVVRPGLWLKA